MSTQKIRLLIRSAAGLLVLASAAVIAWAFQSPVAVNAQSELAMTRRSVPRQAKLIGSPPLEDFSSVWKIELRRPLYDPPPPPKEPRKNKKDPQKKRKRDAAAQGGGLRLVGTMLESGRSIAVFTNSSGNVEMKGVGEMLELSPDARVDRIDLTQVTISLRGRETVLQLPKTKAN